MTVGCCFKPNGDQIFHFKMKVQMSEKLEHQDLVSDIELESLLIYSCIFFSYTTALTVQSCQFKWKTVDQIRICVYIYLYIKFIFIYLYIKVATNRVLLCPTGRKTSPNEFLFKTR